MQLRTKISGWLVTFAFLLTFMHAAIPHHHHGDMVCFCLTCEEACHHHECDACHSEHGDGDCDCACHSHPSHQHDDDNCVLTLPYIIPDHTDLGAQLDADYSFHYQYFTYVVPIDWALPSPTETAEFAFFTSDEGLPDTPSGNGFLLRGPPAC